MKLLEAYKRGLEKDGERALQKRDFAKSKKYDALTTKALDGLMAAVEVAAVMNPFQAIDLSAFMDGDLARDLVPSEDDIEDDVNFDDDEDDEEIANDENMHTLSAQPMTRGSTRSVKLPKSGGTFIPRMRFRTTCSLNQVIRLVGASSATTPLAPRTATCRTA